MFYVLLNFCFDYIFVEYCSKYGNVWPLLSEVKNVLEESSPEMIRLLDVDDDLISVLQRSGYFTEQQLGGLLSTCDQRERCRKLLDVLFKSSMGKFNQFVRYIGNTWFGRSGLLQGSAGK